jgi:hypothetical protein
MLIMRVVTKWKCNPQTAEMFSQLVADEPLLPEALATEVYVKPSVWMRNSFCKLNLNKWAKWPN